MRSDTGEARWEFRVTDLLAKLEVNRDQHREEAEQARRGYYVKAVEKLQELLGKAETANLDGDRTTPVETYVNLSFPEDHTKDYNRIIDVLEMTNAETVKLTLSEFDKYVRDNWEWTSSFKMSSEFYNETK